MSQEPETGVVDVDTEEWPPPEGGGGTASADDDLAQPEAGGEPARQEPAPSGAATVEDRAQRRHARPRDLRRLATMALGVAVVVAVGFALYFWLQLGSARSEGGTAPVPADLSDQLAEVTARLAETEQALREAQVRVVDAETEARDLQEQLDATVDDSADADDELADAAAQLRAVTESLAEAQGESEALASAVLGSVDPVDACVRAVARVAQNVDQIGRGQLARQARDAAATCAAAEDSLGPAVSRARGVLAD
jgi:septal ring factor EnvC (AmiA/AmiB activator)